MEVEISNKYKPLFTLFQDNQHKDVDTVIITGGRYSLKSYTVSIFALAALVYYGWNVLYTRFTNMSIIDSIKPELTDKIELLGLAGVVQDTNTHIEYKGNRIAFKGIKTGSLGQTANLKSLSGFNLFINDEAEELPDYKTFKKIFYSIRSIGKRNLTILILNPTEEDHWIHQEFFVKRKVTDGFNGVNQNILYIHGTYLDADQNKIPKNILADYNRLKEEDPEAYENIVMGGWLSKKVGALWTRDLISKNRVDVLPELARVVIPVDPAVTHNDQSDETGIIPVAMGTDGHFYVIGDYTGKYSPAQTARRIHQAYNEKEADMVVGEVNNGGDYIEEVISLVGGKLPYKSVHAARGKQTRAEPIALLYSQGRVHHFGTYPKLEDEMCNWVPDSGAKSPNRIDALVWGIKYLLGEDEDDIPLMFN